MVRVNHLDDADLQTLRRINERLYDERRLEGDDRRDLANVMRVILDRIETTEVELKEPEHG